MWFVAASLFTFLITLIPGVAAKVESTIDGISSSLTEGPVKTVTCSVSGSRSALSAWGAATVGTLAR